MHIEKLLTIVQKLTREMHKLIDFMNDEFENIDNNNCNDFEKVDNNSENINKIDDIVENIDVYVINERQMFNKVKNDE